MSELQYRHFPRELVSEAVQQSAQWKGEYVGLCGCKQRLQGQSVVKVAGREVAGK